MHEQPLVRLAPVSPVDPAFEAHLTVVHRLEAEAHSAEEAGTHQAGAAVAFPEGSVDSVVGIVLELTDQVTEMPAHSLDLEHQVK